MKDFPDTFNPDQFWHEITQSEDFYHSSRSKSSHIVSPVLRYVHRYITYSLSGRGDSNGNVTKTDLLFLWCMTKRVRLNSGYWLAKHIQKVALSKTGRIVVGPFVTMLAEYLRLPEV